MLLIASMNQLDESEVLDKFEIDKKKLDEKYININNYFVKNHKFSRDFCFCSKFSVILKLFIQILYFEVQSRKNKSDQKQQKIGLDQTMNLLLNSYVFLEKNICIASVLYDLSVHLIMLKILEKNSLFFLFFNKLLKKHS